MPRPLIDRARCLLLAVATLLAGCVSGPRWTASEDGRFYAETNGWSLAVHSDRARLAELVPPGGEVNVLAAGGHIVWLGPQAEWAREWPPPRDWHRAAAERIERRDRGRTLRVVGAHTDPSHPRIVRDYTLRSDGLDLTVRWQGDSTARQIVQIIQLLPETKVHVVAEPTPELPHGVGHLPLVPARDPLRVDLAPEPRFVSRGSAPDRLVLHRGDGDAKYGFPPRELWAELPSGARLGLAPGPWEGAWVETLDAGLTTQVYLGRADLEFVEIEQLSPRLRPARTGEAVSHTSRLLLPPVTHPSTFDNQAGNR